MISKREIDLLRSKTGDQLDRYPDSEFHYLAEEQLKLCHSECAVTEKRMRAGEDVSEHTPHQRKCAEWQDVIEVALGHWGKMLKERARAKYRLLPGETVGERLDADREQVAA